MLLLYLDLGGNKGCHAMNSNFNKSFFFYMDIFIKVILFVFIFHSVFAQALVPSPKEQSQLINNEKKLLKTPSKVNVRPETKDIEISKRIEDILKATGWFIEPKVKVQNGVVFLYGKAKNDEYRDWADELASKTQDTVGVVNQIQVVQPSILEFSPILNRFENQWRNIIRMIPSLILGLTILIMAWFTAKLIAFIAKKAFLYRLQNPLLQKIVGWSITLGVFLLGLYLLFYLMGLTGIALTVIGGTGLLGIILGIAFKDITENLLASIFLSINNPFNAGDLIEIIGIVGYVQSLTIRSTILINLEGNYIQIPNATVYKNSIRNFSSNPNRREDFSVGIGYECNIAQAQEIALDVLKNHPAVLNEPEPWVLVNNLGKSTINLQMYFWLDGNKHSWLKVRSSVIRLIKKSFEENNISMPDSEREIIFPKGISVRIDKKNEFPDSKQAVSTSESEMIATAAENQLGSEAQEIEKQAKQSHSAEEGSNLLKPKKEDDKRTI